MGGVPLENRNEVGERGMGKLYDIMAKAKVDWDIEVFNSLKFLVPEEPNEDGNLTYMFIADPYLEDKNYDIFEILVSSILS